jgi:hypothetical protein
VKENPPHDKDGYQPKSALGWAIAIFSNCCGMNFKFKKTQLLNSHNLFSSDIQTG